MSWAPAFAALFFGFLSSFVIHHIARNRYNFKQRCWHNVPPLYRNAATRWLYFLFAAILLITAIFYATPWWICSIVIVWNVMAWQSGTAMEHSEHLQSMTDHLMQSENLSLDEARKKASEILAITEKYPQPF